MTKLRRGGKGWTKREEKTGKEKKGDNRLEGYEEDDRNEDRKWEGERVEEKEKVEETQKRWGSYPQMVALMVVMIYTKKRKENEKTNNAT